MKHILSLSLGSSRSSSSELIPYKNTHIRYTQLGVDFDIDLFESILRSYDGTCDAICINYLPAIIYLKHATLKHDIYDRIDRAVRETPVFFGHHLRSIVMNWTVRKSMESGQFKTADANILYLTALTMHDLAKSLESSSLSNRYLDTWTFMRAPVAFRTIASLEKYLSLGASKLRKRPLRAQTVDKMQDRVLRPWLSHQIERSDIIVTPARILETFDLSLLKGKTILLDSMTDSIAHSLVKAGVQNAYYPSLKLSFCKTKLPYSVMEAFIAFETGQENSLSQEDLLDFFNTEKIDANLEQLDQSSAEIPRKYAFVIHPLSQRDLFRHPLTRPLIRLPKPAVKQVEHQISKIPGLFYGRITGVRSEATGVYAEGLIYFLGATPREMLAAKPEVIYRKILKISEDARKKGAKMIGLGAFTKIVGDAGVTIAERSLIPVTTGNSLSAAATLWAAKDACRKMGFLKPLAGDPIRVDGTVMVIGATGSIGKACTSVLGASFNRIIIAAINAPRLMAYKMELEAMYPDVQVQITTQPARFAAECDLIVVSTSATEGGAFGLENVKPGCVICDVSRPLTFSADVALTRPDVLIIESGEIELPGDDVKVDCDLGLEDSVVYACLAETALLTLEGRYESFTLSRNINYKKVKEIYKIARKHGARLAQIRSPNGIITDQEIELCREHALSALSKGVKHG